MQISDLIAGAALIVSGITAWFSFSQMTSAKQQAQSSAEQARLAKEQAEQAKRQVEEAARQVTEMQEANRIAHEALTLQKHELEERQRVEFRFEPGEAATGAVLRLRNDSPFNLYVVSMQLYGPKVNPEFRGIVFHDIRKLGGEPFIRTREAEIVLRHDLSEDADVVEIMPAGSTIELRMNVKVEGKIYEIDSKVTLSKSGDFSTRETERKIVG